MGLSWFRQELTNLTIYAVGMRQIQNKQLNGNIFNKVVGKVKSLFASNCVAFA